MPRLQMRRGDSQVKPSVARRLIIDDQRIMVEVAGGSALSLIYEDLLKKAVPGLTESSTVVVIVCGGCSLCALLIVGSSVTMESLTAFRKLYENQ